MGIKEYTSHDEYGVMYKKLLNHSIVQLKLMILYVNHNGFKKFLVGNLFIK